MIDISVKFIEIAQHAKFTFVLKLMFFSFLNFFLQVWSNYEEPKQEQVVEEPLERKINYRNVVVTEVMNDLKFYGQYVENGRYSS